jgi:twinkle protein
MDAKELSNQLALQAENVARYLYPNGKKESNNWRIGDVNGSEGQSLSICLTGSQAGRWKDFSTNEGGDLIDLMAAKNRTGIPEALNHAKDYLGCNDTRTPLIAPPPFTTY